MIDELATIVEEFPGAENRTRCFTHILNLVCKCILKQFDIPKAKADAIFDEAVVELRKLAGEIEEDEMEASFAMNLDADDEDDAIDIEGLDELTVEEKEEMERSVQPVRLVLVKVS